jgi:hypothetical protein
MHMGMGPELTVYRTVQSVNEAKLLVQGCT